MKMLRKAKRNPKRRKKKQKNNKKDTVYSSHRMNSSQKKLEKSEVEIDIELSAEELEAYREDALAVLGKDMRVEGFRPGHAPSQVVERKIGESSVLEKMARSAISESYTNFIQQEGLDVIGDPEVQILKLAPGNPFEYRIRVAVLPEIELPDYKKLAGEKERKKVTVEEKEVQDALEWLQKSKKEDVAGATDLKMANPADVSANKEELSDEFAKSLGNFENLAALKESVNEGLQHEKEMQETDRLRQEIIENITEEARMEIPDILIEREKAVLLENVKKGIGSVMQMEFEDYLQKSGKTEQELLESFASEAEQRVKKFLVLREVARREQIAVTKEEIEEEANNILAHYKDASSASKEIDPLKLREYTEGVIRHEKTLQFLQQFAKAQPAI